MDTCELSSCEQEGLPYFKEAIGITVCVEHFFTIIRTLKKVEKNIPDHLLLALARIVSEKDEDDPDFLKELETWAERADEEFA